MIEGTMKKHKVKGLCKYIDVRMYSACPNKRGGIVELSGVGNPKNFNHIERGRRRFTFVRSQKKDFEAGVIG